MTELGYGFGQSVSLDSGFLRSVGLSQPRSATSVAIVSDNAQRGRIPISSPSMAGLLRDRESEQDSYLCYEPNNVQEDIVASLGSHCA